MKIIRSPFYGSHIIARLNFSQHAITSSLPNFILPGLIPLARKNFLSPGKTRNFFLEKEKAENCVKYLLSHFSLDTNKFFCS